MYASWFKFLASHACLHCTQCCYLAHRSILANQLAETAREWIDIIARYNSGTYVGEISRAFITLAGYTTLLALLNCHWGSATELSL